MYYVYILKSIKDKKGYIGTTNNVKERLQAHNSGQVKSTKHRRPLIVIHTEEFKTLSEARKQEWYYKYTPQGGKLKRIILSLGAMHRDPWCETA